MKQAFLFFKALLFCSSLFCINQGILSCSSVKEPPLQFLEATKQEATKQEVTVSKIDSSVKVELFTSDKDAQTFPETSTSQEEGAEDQKIQPDLSDESSEKKSEPHRESNTIEKDSTPDKKDAFPEHFQSKDNNIPPEKSRHHDHIGKTCQVGSRKGACKDFKLCVGKNEAIRGFCSGSANIQCCVKKQSVPAGTCDPKKRPQPNQNLKQTPGSSGCKAGMIRINHFCIDRYEAHLVEIRQNGTLSPHSPYFNPGTKKVKALSIKSAIPQGYISGAQAARACKAAGKRLCTDKEWLRACRGSQKQTYPYGSTRKPGVCNDARKIHPAVEYFKSSASWVFSKIGHQCLNQLPNGLKRTGAASGCKTSEGAFDMMGNLHEWTADPKGTFRGGFYVDTYRNGSGCLYRTTAHSVHHWDYSTGFRCCSNAQ